MRSDHSIYDMTKYMSRLPLWAWVAFMLSSPVQAGFEWTPPAQDTSSVPVVKRQAATPSEQVGQQPLMPAVLPSLSHMEHMKSEPNSGVKTIRKASEAATQNSMKRSSGMRMIEKSLAYKVPAVQPVDVSPLPVVKSVISEQPAVREMKPLPSFTPLPADMPSLPATKNVASNNVEIGIVEKASQFTPLPYEPYVDERQVKDLREIVNRQPVPQVAEAMRELSANKVVRRSPPVSSIVPVIEVSIPKSSADTLMINPYPKKEALASPHPAYVPTHLSATLPSSSVAPSVYEQASGFGNDIPMIMALQQIVPEHYTYSFASGVNPAQSVSWSGGQGWDRVVGDMLQPLGLRASIRGKTIFIGR